MSNMGWICPRCDKVHAPHVSGCDCRPLPDLIGKPLPTYPTPEITKWPIGPLPPYVPNPPVMQPIYPMPVCGCRGPCGNAACPHMPKITCATFGQFSIAQ